MISRRARACLSLLLVATAATSAAPARVASAATPVLPPPDHPGSSIEIDVPERAASFANSHGVAALERANSRLSGSTLRRLISDRSTWVDTRGRVYVQDQMTAGPPRPELVTDPVLTAPHPLADTFLLHTRPGSAHTIYLDFNGQVVTSDFWTASNAGMPIRAEGLDFDDSPTAFNAEERSLVQDVWARVAEDFAGFDVDITTQDPGSAALSRTSTADPTYGVRVVFSSFNPIMSHCGCSGIAYLGVFNEPLGGETPPAWVEMPSSQLFVTGDELADIASHEVGHTLGLSHDGLGGTFPSEYYGGQGIWAPIMGMGRQPLTQWSNGSYTNANNKEDDLAVISSFGLPRLGDDHGDSAASATPLPSGAIDQQGTINAGTDVDVFSLTTDGSPLDISALPADQGANSDLRVELRSADGATVLATDNPVATASTSSPDATGTAAHLFVPSLAAGNYTLWIRPSGQGSVTTDGYDTYGAIGRYRIITGAPTLSVTRGGDGAGQVVAATAGIDCGVTCSIAIEPRTAVVLVAIADPGSVFTGWGGACGGDRITCSVSTDAPVTTVSAHFVLVSAAPVLTAAVDYVPDPDVFTAPSVTSSPPGIQCNVDFPEGCTAPFERD